MVTDINRGARGNGFDANGDLQIDTIDLGHVAFQQAAVKRLHQLAQGEVIPAILLQIVIDDREQFFALAHASFPR